MALPTAPYRTPTRLTVVGGFLGSGKTTSLLRLAERAMDRGERVGIITNDQAEGLVDTQRFQGLGFDAGEVAGGCFCCRFDDFLARADELLARTQPDLLLAEPVGSCTDLVATVLRPLARFHSHRFAISPFTVLVDPLRALDVLGGRGATRFSDKVTYIFRLQQQEADSVAINKIDLLSDAERGEVEALIRQRFPEARVFAFSATTGEGFEAWASHLESAAGSEALPLAEIDYDVYAEGEAQLGWLNSAVRLRAREPVDVDRALCALAGALQRTLRADGIEIAHAKLLLRGDRRSAVVSVVASDAEPQLAQAATEQARELDLVVNLRAQGEPERVEGAFRASLDGWAAGAGLDLLEISGQAFKPPRPVPTHRIAGA